MWAPAHPRTHGFREPGRQKRTGALAGCGCGAAAGGRGGGRHTGLSLLSAPLPGVRRYGTGDGETEDREGSRPACARPAAGAAGAVDQHQEAGAAGKAECGAPAGQRGQHPAQEVPAVRGPSTPGGGAGGGAGHGLRAWGGGPACDAAVRFSGSSSSTSSGRSSGRKRPSPSATLTPTGP